jgi:glycerophosphoryl diester phosphodiesterase
MANQPLIIGHRGASAVAPENTLAAFKRAIQIGADGVEFDVRLASDGVPVVIHDETLQRTALVQKRVADLSAAELQQLNVGSWFSRSREASTDEFAAETIPTLQQLFELFASTPALLYLEMKSDPSQRTQLAAACCRLLRDSSLRQRVIVECFDLAAIEAVKGIEPGIRTAALFQPKLSRPHSMLMGQHLVDRAKAAGADEIALHYKLASHRIIDKARLASLKVVVWTVDDPTWIQRARRSGIDALITNDPARMLRQRDTLRAD